LIVNELVTNAVKHAFRDGHEGHIFVRLVRQDANTALVSVRDDGIGLPPDFDLSMSKGLGMRIVAALAKQFKDAIAKSETANVGFETVVRAGQAAEAIAQVARDKGIEHIVMGTRGLGRIQGLLLGSVAMKVIHLAQVPITLIK
jgi:nucleotide-binding universal stress UspA family protein